MVEDFAGIEGFHVVNAAFGVGRDPLEVVVGVGDDLDVNAAVAVFA